MSVPTYTDISGMERQSLGIFIPGSGEPVEYIDNTGAVRETVGVFLTGGGLRIERMTLTSDGSGIATATYADPFDDVPNVHLELLSGNDRQQVRLTSSDASGFTAIVEERNTAFLSLLGLDVLTSGVSPVSGAQVIVTIIEKGI